MRRHLSKFVIILSVALTLGYVITYAATGTPSNLVVRTDANNALVVTSVTQVNPVTQGIFSSRTLRTDASGNLQVILSGTVTPTYPQAIPASTCAAPSLGLSGGATTGIAFTSTPSILNCIAGVNTFTIESQSVTSGSGAANSAAQINILGNRSGSGLGLGAFNFLNQSAASADKFVARIQGTPSSTLDVDGGQILFTTYDDSGVAGTRLTITETGNITIGNVGAILSWTGRTLLTSNANALLNVINNAGTVGIQLNTGTAAPTVTSCGTGTVTTGSRNTTGQITATGATACTITFGSPAWSNTPFCTVTLANAVTTTPYISAASTTAITVSGLTAGDIFNYHCIGRI